MAARRKSLDKMPGPEGAPDVEADSYSTDETARLRRARAEEDANQARRFRSDEHALELYQRRQSYHAILALVVFVMVSSVVILVFSADTALRAGAWTFLFSGSFGIIGYSVGRSQAGGPKPR